MTLYPRIAILILILASAASGQIPVPADAPKPLTPTQSAKAVTLPAGFRLELIASEPMIREPSGMCWDEKGRLYVCELHGYNYEGQLDIEELNKTGTLDREVRRYFVEPRLMEKAKKERYGTIKRIETDASGRATKATVFADRLPACYGMVPARGGLIVACGPDILYLADRDGDGVAEVRETLFTGFTVEIMERAINAPQWGLDGWIYFGRGQSGCTVTGPKLKAPVTLPHTDFRIWPDGSAIEPIPGGTRTIGFATTELGDRYVIGTPTPALYVPPLGWNYLSRNPYVASSVKEVDVNSDQRCYPTSRPHPWRTARAEDPGFAKYYRDHYGAKEAAANGFFTSLCSPLVYQDAALPGLRGQLFACEPAQNLITRGVLQRTGDLPRLSRVKGEEKSEFLASRDIWFHPIALAHAPDGSIVIADFYREIIEDYSAIPRYLQQQYGLMNGEDHGRVWRLTHDDAAKAPPADMSGLTVEQLAKEVASPHFWRRETARRLLIERGAKATAPVLATLLSQHTEPAAILNALYTLDGLGELHAAHVEPILAHANPGIRVHALRLAERWLNDRPDVLKKVLALADDADAMVRLQAALSLGGCRDAQVLPVLAHLARERGNQRWMPTALLSSLAGRSGVMLVELLQNLAHLGQAGTLVEPLCASIAARRDAKELSESLVQVAALRDRNLQRTCLRGFQASLKSPAPVALGDEARAAMKQLAGHSDAEIRHIAESLVIALKLEEPAQRTARIARATRDLNDVEASVEIRLAAVTQLAFDDDPRVIVSLLAAVPTSTPNVRDAILAAAFSRRDQLGLVIEAVETKRIPAALLSALQRAALLDIKDPALRSRAVKLFQASSGSTPETFKQYVAALAEKRDAAHGEAVFRQRCAICHQAHGLGIAVGPNLSSEFQRAEETIVKDILAPNDVISAGFTTYMLETKAGLQFSGILAVESASSVTLRGPEGKEQVVLRKDIDSLKALSISLMPDDLPKVLSPKDVADVIAWLRNPPAKVTLLDENPDLAALLNEGKGTAQFVRTDKFSGEMALRVTPLQRAAAKIPGWDYKIRENPGPGEYRHLRFAWKAEGDGVMIELAAGGLWPKANQSNRRYFSGKNTSGWKAVQVAADPPRDWTVVTVDLWKDCGNFTLTGFAPTAMGGPALFDKIELLRTPKD
jgi:putative membrane-bound dehydrogenase-like protein